MRGSVRHIPALALAVFALFMAGCSIDARIKLQNRSGKTITVRSGHGQKIVTTIKSEKTGIVQHTAGPVRIEAEGHPPWVYSDIDVPTTANLSAKYHDIRKGLFKSTLTLHLVVEADGKVYVLPVSSKQREKYQSKQPKGFPLLPTIEKQTE